MPRPDSAALHRAKRKKQTAWRDEILCLVDHLLGEALGLLDTMEAARKEGVRLERADKMVGSAASRVHGSRLILREYLYDDPTP